MGGQTIRNEAERVADIRVQTSAYGSTIPWLLTGRARGAGNLLWYGNFRAIKHTSTTNSGGKGGGGVRQETVTYTYEAAVVVGLARGPLLSAGAVWRGKQQLPSLAAAGLSFAQGDVGQPMWSWLQGYAPAEALNYSGLAYAYAQAYSLDDSAALPNHNFELDAGGLGSVVGVMEPVVDGDPRLAVERLLTDARSGAGWPLERLQGLDRYQTYCRAAGLWLSPLLSEQRSALDWLRQLLMLTNTRAAWTGSALELVPLGDETISAHGVTYEANTTPDFDLTLDHFQPDEDEPPVRVRRHVGLASEAAAATTDDVGFNVITLEIENRAAGYALQPITRDDLASIERYGRRPKDTIKAPEVKDPAIGAQICQQLLQDELVKRNRYEFTLSWKFSRLRPLRLVTLTEPSLDLDRTPVRVLEVEELDDRRVAVVAEDAPIGTASAPRYGTQAGKGFDQNYAVAPGTVTDVAIFEAPAPLAAGGTGLEVWCAVASPGGPWGGCTVWVSLDGDSYRQMGRVTGGARMGLLAEPVAGALLEVHSMTGQLVGASAADAQALATLSVVLGAEPEYLAYQGAMLTGASAYTLSGLVRGAYGTPSPTHAAGDRFVRIDGDIAKSGGLDVGLIGKRIWFKFTSFNVFGVAEQSLADVSAHAYDITGVFARLAPGTAGRGLQLKASALAVKQDASGDRLPAAITLTAELKGTLLGAPVWSVRSGAATLSGSGMQRIVDTSTLVPPARIRVELTDEVGTYADEVTLTVLENGADGVSGNKYALVSLYQWSTTQPGAPSGESTWAWATARHSAYTGGNGWQVGIPPNPGFPGVLLWAASQQISAGGGTVSSQLTWSAGSATISAVGANGVGMQSAEAAVYAWASNLAALPPLTGVSTYTWASSSLDAAPAGWSLAPGAVAGPGLTLFKAVVRLTDATTSATSNVDWTLSGTSAVGFAGVSGAPGQAGASARIAYTKVTGATIGAGTVETDGPASLPLDNAWGRGEVWSATVPAFGPDESVMQTNGVYNPATGKTVWGSPYLSSWRVGKLSSITADIGSITAGSLNIGGGRFQVSASGYLVARGAQLLDEAGNVVFSTRAGASVQLPASWVDPAPSWLNSSIGIDAGGRLYGAGAGNGLAISNNQLSLSSTGALLNGGQVQGQVQTVPVRDDYAERGTDRPPSWYPVGTTREFKVSAAVGLGGADNYLTLETVIQYPDASGGSCYQYAYRGETTWRRWGTCGAAAWAGNWVRDLDRKAYTGDLDATYGAIWGGNVAGRPGNLAALGGGELINNGQISIGSGGELLGIGAGAGTRVSNNQIVLGADGKLYNAGTVQGQVTAPGLGIRTFKVVTTGGNGQHPQDGVWASFVKDVDTGQPIGYGGARSYVLQEFSQTDFSLVFQQTYDVYGNGDHASPDGLHRNAASMRGDLNYICDNRRGNYIVVRGFDEPRNNRGNDGLLEAMCRCGASRAKFGSPNFPFRAAYILVGRAGIGEGGGVEQLSPVGDQAGAWAELTMTWAKGVLTVSGAGAPRQLTDFGPFTQASWDVMMDNAYIRASHIQSLSVGVLSTTMNGGSSEGIRMETNKLMVFSGGQEVVRVGYLY